jgi:hypothetical protein
VNAAFNRELSWSRSASLTGSFGVLRYGDEIGRLLTNSDYSVPGAGQSTAHVLIPLAYRESRR